MGSRNIDMNAALGIAAIVLSIVTFLVGVKLTERRLGIEDQNRRIQSVVKK